jgi:hypothetical protein
MIVIKVKKDYNSSIELSISKYNKIINDIDDSKMFRFIGNSRIDGCKIYRMIDEKLYLRSCKIQKIKNNILTDKSFYELRETIMDKIRNYGQVELVSTLEEQLGFINLYK